MLIHLLNFPEFARQAVAQILSEYGHTTAALPYAGLFESIDPGESFPLVLVYDYAVSEETTSLYHQLNVRFPGSVVWLVCPSYRPEDVRTALLGGYANYILWSPDLEDLRQAVMQLGSSPQLDLHNTVDIFHVVNYPMDQQLAVDRLLGALTAQSGRLASSYIPLLYRMKELQNCWYAVCTIQKLLPISLYFREDFEDVQSITATQLRLHIETLENTFCPSFGILKYVENGSAICLFYHKEQNFCAEMLRFLSQLSRRIQLYQGISVQIGYSHPYHRLEETHIHYNRIRTNLIQGQVNTPSGIQLLDEARAFTGFSKETDDYIKNNLYLAIANNDFDLISKTLIDAADRFTEKRVVVSLAKAALLQTLIRFAQETNFYLLVNQEFIEHRFVQAFENIPLLCEVKELFLLLKAIYAEAQKSYYDDGSNRLTLAMQYIQKNYYRKISLQSISDHLALTPNYFCSWFKKESGENFADAVIRCRIDAAKCMLTQSDKKIYDIAGEVGYSEIVSFNRAFKKLVGMTPSQYRSRHSENVAG